MANSLKAWGILGNATADIPAAGDTGGHHFDQTLLMPLYDNGSANVPWRANFALPLFTSTSFSSPCGNTLWGPFASSTSQVQTRLDFTRFRQARLTVRGDLAAALTSDVQFKVQDLTNGHTVGAMVGLTDTAWAITSSAWTNLQAQTYAGDAVIELQWQAPSDNNKVAMLGSVVLELR